MTINDILKIFEESAPFIYQESYDNSGLQLGDHSDEINGALLTIDVTEEIISEAIKKGMNLIISHHPLIFSGIKRISEKTSTERIIRRAIREGINIISLHTNIDNSSEGVNSKICEKLSLKKTRILQPAEGKLLKLSVFVPESHVEIVRESLFSAGAGVIGDYDFCSFNTKGTGTFRGSETTNPFTGKKGVLHFENEVKVETILPIHLKEKVVKSLLNAHPYEEVAYDLYPLVNQFVKAGAGMTGVFDKAMDETDFLNFLKKTFNSPFIRHTPLSGKKIRKVAVCGGSGIFLLKNAISEEADAFVTGDVKYHQFFEADGKILLVDVGHYESEQFTKELFYELLKKKLPNFALHLSEVNTNPINYI